MRRSRHLLIVSIVLGPLLSPAAAQPPPNSTAADHFRDRVAPILTSHCLRCHSAANAKGEISLATAEGLRDNDFVVPGDPDASYLVELIVPAGNDEPPQMPKEGDPLSPEQVDAIRSWIADGAEWPDDVVLREPSRADRSWWSLQPLEAAPIPPPTEGLDGWDHPIDRYIAARLAAEGLRPNPRADRRTLIRRATYDLWGLPPTPQEVEAFVNDDDPRAYEKLIDRLLASPHYGERWGRHWLDVVRFGESNGFERNVIINDLWPFRDYVIESLNDDKPVNLLIREHLAGDVFGKDQPELEVGTAFLVAGPYDDVGNQDPVQAAQIRANTIDEMIRATSEAFLGLTVGCARCHDHKFDPILQEDYYALYSAFAGVRHGRRTVATPEDRATYEARVQPLQSQLQEVTAERDSLRQAILDRGLSRLETYSANWVRDPIDRTGTEETFEPVEARFVRLVSKGQDQNPQNAKSFGVDEFEVWSAGPDPQNVALASRGATASGSSRVIEDFPGAYGPQLAIDGETGARFLATDGHLTIQLAEPTRIDRVRFSSARGESAPEQPKFAFVAEYHIEVSGDGETWTQVADSNDRRPANEAHRNHRVRQLEMTGEERRQLAELNRRTADLNREIAAVPPLPVVWVGERRVDEASGPFHVFLGGSPQRLGDEVVPASLSSLDGVTPSYELSTDSDESERRLALADWIVHPDNPLTPRVLANRLWHYHFGTGIVDTPSDLGYMGGRPTHPELLDWLALQIQEHDWRLKPIHKMIMLSETYRQSSAPRPEAASIDGDSRLLWRFPPRRLSAEEIRDTMLQVAGELDTTMGGPGFRLYHFMQDNVSTYAPLDEHGPETYRRAVYHQNARASVVDLMTDFDQPDCAFSAPRRAETTTPLQALTMLNHSFTIDMSESLAQRLVSESGTDVERQIVRAFALCYSRQPTDVERAACRQFAEEYGLTALCRVLLNTSELIYVR